MVTNCLLVQNQVTIAASIEEACDKAEAVVIATEWAEFRKVDWEKIYAKMSKPAFVFDGRLIVDAEKLRKIGFKVTSIGRGESLAWATLAWYSSVKDPFWILLELYSPIDVYKVYPLYSVVLIT